MRICQGNNWQLGTSGLYISPFQWEWNSICLRANCHKNGFCIPRCVNEVLRTISAHCSGINTWECRCGDDYVDLQVEFLRMIQMNNSFLVQPNGVPGVQCQSRIGVNECLGPNECDPKARCIDEEVEYRCQCMNQYLDKSPPGARPGSKCVFDFCSDLGTCPANTTCKINEERQEPRCECIDGYIDIRNVRARISLGLKDVLCLPLREVDECALGLTDCSGVAACKDTIEGKEL